MLDIVVLNSMIVNVFGSNLCKLVLVFLMFKGINNKIELGLLFLFKFYSVIYNVVYKLVV